MLQYDPSLPAGMRNNNPGNLKWSGSPWQRRTFTGMLGPSTTHGAGNTDQGDPQIAFRSPEDGMQAAVKLALVKYDGGKRTVRSLIAGENGWTPGYTAAAENIAQNMGITPDDPINLRDPRQMRGFMRALLFQEHGPASRQYDDTFIGGAVDTILQGSGGGDQVPSASPDVSGTPQWSLPNFNRTSNFQSRFVSRDGTVTEGQYDGVDYRLRNIINVAAEAAGLQVKVIAGKEPRNSGFHPSSKAIDIQLYLPDGTPIPTGAGGLKSAREAAAGFSAYEQFAKLTRQIQMQYYPELANEFRWGGYFSGGPDRYGSLDTMHFDLGGSAMAGGSWEGGLSVNQRKLWEEAGYRLGGPTLSLPDLGQGSFQALSSNSVPTGEGYNYLEQARESQVSFADMEVPSYESTTMRLEAERDEDDDDPSFFDGVSAAVGEWSPVQLFRNFQTAYGQEFDPNYRVTKEWLKSNASNIPVEYLDNFEDAMSEDHALAILDRIELEMEARETLADMGTLGTVLSVSGALTDPGAWAATAGIALATGGTGLPAALAARFGRAGLFGLGAAEGAASNLLTDAPYLMGNPLATGQEALWSLGAGAAIGGAVGLVMHPRAASAAANRHINKVGVEMQRDVVDDIVEGSMNPGSVGAARVDSGGLSSMSLDDQARAYRALDKMYPSVFNRVRWDLASRFNVSTNPAMRAIGNFLVLDAVGRKAGNVTEQAVSEAVVVSHRTAQAHWSYGLHKAWQKEKKDRGLRFWNEGPERRKFFERIVDYAGDPDANRRLTAYTAAEREAGEHFRSMMKSWWQQARDAGLTLSEDGIENYVPRIDDIGKFHMITDQLGSHKPVEKLLTNAIISAQPRVDPKLAKRLAKAMVRRKRSLKRGEEASDWRGAQGLDDAQMREILEQYGELDEAEIDEILDAFGMGRQAADEPLEDAPVPPTAPEAPEKVSLFGEDMDLDKAIKAVKEEIRNVKAAHRRKPDDTSPKPKLRGWSVEKLENKLDELEDTADAYNKVKRAYDREYSAYRFKKEAWDEKLKNSGKDKPKDPNRPARMKRRIILDENYKMTAFDKNGARMELSVKDFYIRDAHTLMTMYNRQMAGHVALARLRVPNPLWDGTEETDRFLVEGIKNPNEVDGLINKIIKIGELEGSSPDQLARDRQHLQFAFDAIRGVPAPGAGTNWGRALAILRDYNFVRLMGQMGFAQAAELGRGVGWLGGRAIFQGVPLFRKMLNGARNGRFPDELAEEIDSALAPGRDWDIHRYHLPVDAFESPVQFSRTNRIAEGAEKTLHKLGRGIAMGSFMQPVNALLQKAVTHAFVFAVTRKALTGRAKGITPKRMALLGLDEKTFEAIQGQIKKHASFRHDDRRWSMLEAMNFKNWDDPDLVAKFHAATARAARNTILENDIGSMHPWMRHPVWGSVLQFRGFALGAWSRATLQGLNMRDPTALMQFLTSGFLGMWIYMGQTHLRLIGDPDREKKLEERLAWEEIGKAFFLRTSESSILPIPIDFMSEMMGGGPFFAYQRSSGLAGSVAGIPTIDTIDTARRAVQGVTSAVAGDDFSRQDADSWTDLTTNMLGIGNILTWLISDMPNEEREFDGRR